MQTTKFKILTISGFSRGSAYATTKVRAYIKGEKITVLEKDKIAAAKRCDDSDISLPDVAGYKTGWIGTSSGLHTTAI